MREQGLRTFIPMMVKKSSSPTSCTSSPTHPTSSPTYPTSSQTPPTSSPTRSGISRKLVPAITGLVFVHTTRETLDSYIRSFGEDRPVNYYWDRTSNRPLTVPDKDMENFIAVASTLDEDLIYLTEISDKLREGQKVIVKEGPFKGVEGKVVRIRKSRRIMVEIPGMLAVASTYVEMGNVEII